MKTMVFSLVLLALFASGLASEECPDGYTGTSGNCTDINECEDMTACSHILNGVCTNNEGSYSCGCDSDYIQCNGSCIVNNCPDCGDNGYCDCSTNFQCRCDYGYTGSTGMCEDIDECQVGSPCDHINGSMCVNTNGSYYCACPSDKVICNSSCTVDTCTTCGANAYCGCGTGFQCECFSGYTGDGNSCEDINECLDSSACDHIENGVCTNNNGSYSCAHGCDSGYIFCNDTCIVEQTCPDCGDYGYCNCYTGFQCQCFSGYTSNNGSCEGNLTCPPCGDYAYCSGYPYYECRCRSGFEQVDGECVDIDECADECRNYCNSPNGSICYNTIGSFKCVCPTGYTECNGYRCILNGTCPDYCGENETCNCNTGFQCECNYGYERNYEGDCVDIDECANYTSCSYREGTVCYNTPGSYDCLCEDGYIECNYGCTLNGTCPDCANDSYCSCSTDFECRCNSGYTGASGSCEDIDECENNNTCAYREGTACMNTDGSYDCVCEEGYVQCDYSYQCAPNGTCPECGEYADCSCQTDFECRCRYGFTGDGGYCEDIDECELYDYCDYGRESGRVCVNTVGSYECTCPPGYFYCSTLNQCVSTDGPILLKPTIVDDRYGCYSNDTMDERRDIRCQVRSILDEKIRLLLSDLSGDGSGSGSGRPDGPGGGEGPTGGIPTGSPGY